MCFLQLVERRVASDAVQDFTGGLGELRLVKVTLLAKKNVRA